MKPQIFEWLFSLDVNLEKEVLPDLASKGLLTAYKHEGFWQCADTPRDLEYLNNLYDEGAI